MIGMVLGSIGTPFWPWQTLQVCVLASMSSAAEAGAAATAKTTVSAIPAPKNGEMRSMNNAGFLPPPTARGARTPQVFRQSGKGATRPGRPRFPQFRPCKITGKARDQACSGTQAESRYRNRRLSRESVAISRKIDFHQGASDAKQTDVEHHIQ